MNENHSHDHGHRHPPGHSHLPANFSKAFAAGIGLNIAFVIIEASFGYLSNSVALLADAGHNLSDVLGLVVAWVASVLAKRPPSARYTYGLRGSTILAALFNAVFLLVAVGAIAWIRKRRADGDVINSVAIKVSQAIHILPHRIIGASRESETVRSIEGGK